MGKEKKIGIDNIYVVHALNGYELHEKRVQKIFSKLDFKCQFITDGDPSLIIDTILSKYFVPNIVNTLSTGVLSCTLNHIYCCEYMIKNNDKLALVFENDPFFLGDFLSKITEIVQESMTLEEGFIISLENTTLKFPNRSKIRDNQKLYPANFGRCAGAYLIDRTAARRILQDLETTKCSQVIDWWHNDLIDRKIVRMYWAHPPIVEQGSHNGKLNAGISSHNKSIFRQIKWKMHKFYKTHLLFYFK